MRIGVIGAGNIGAALAGAFSHAGLDVRIANSRGSRTLGALAQRLGGAAADLGEVAAAGVVILAVPFGKVASLVDLAAVVPADTVVADTSNYYPARDGRAEPVERGTPEAVYLQERLGRPIVRAWNALTSHTSPPGPPRPDIRAASRSRSPATATTTSSSSADSSANQARGHLWHPRLKDGAGHRGGCGSPQSGHRACPRCRCDARPLITSMSATRRMQNDLRNARGLR